MARRSRIGQTRMGLSALLALLTAVSVACSGDPVTTFTLDSGGWTATPALIESQRLRFTVRNDDSQPHQPVLIATQMPEDGLPDRSDGYVDLGGIFVLWPGGGGEFAEFSTDFVGMMNQHVVEPGASVTDSVGYFDAPELEPGTYLLICFTLGHYEAGEHTTLEVIAAS